MHIGPEGVLVFFDLDGTLIRGPSCESRFFNRLLRRRVIGWRQLTAFSVAGLRGFCRLEQTPWKKNKAYLAGLTLATVETVARPFVTEQLAGAVHPAVRQRVDHHRDAGDTVILLTGAPDFIARPLSRALGISHTIATKCALSGDRFTIGAPIVHPYGEAKRRLAAQLCRQSGKLLADSIAYANAFSDLPLLNAVGRPVAVCPDRRLRRVAAARQWETIA